MNHHSAFDPNIPVLTEVFPGHEEAPPKDHHALLEQRAIDTWTEPEWTLMERRVSERVLGQLQNRVELVLEQRLRESMEEVLNAALATMTREIGQGLQETIEKIVVRAVAQEVAHLQALKK